MKKETTASLRHGSVARTAVLRNPPMLLIATLLSIVTILMLSLALTAR